MQPYRFSIQPANFRHARNVAAPPSAYQPRSQLGLSSTLGALRADEHARQVLRKHLGALVDHPHIEMALEMTLEQMAGFVPVLLPREKLEIIAAELAQPQ